MADRYDYDPEAFDYAMPPGTTRPEEAGKFVQGAKFAPFRLVGAPVDIAAATMQAVGVPVGDKPMMSSEYLIDKYADLVEAFGGTYQRPTGDPSEVMGDIIGSFALDPGLIAAGIGMQFAKTTTANKTKPRGSGSEVKGTGAAQTKEFIKTRIGYKLFERDPETGTLYPLFVDAKTPVKIGEWQTAEIPFNFTAPNGKQYVPSKKWDGSAGTGDSVIIPDQATRDMLIEKGYLPKGSKAKTIKAVALRPGWHSGEFPVASHIGPEEVFMGQKMKTRGPNQVWAEVEIPDDVDWQTMANERASIVKSGARKGEINRAEAQITDELPMGGNYLYQQGQARDGNWIISGEMRVKRVLDDDEVRAINEAAGMQDLPRLAELMKQSEARTSDLPTVPKKEVLEGEVVGTKSKKYMDLQKQVEEASSPDLRAARELNMETQGVRDAFDLNAATNIDKRFDYASGGDEVRSTSDEFIDGVIDEFQGARDQGFSRGEALIDAIRVKVKDYNDIYPDALDVNSVLDDIAKNVNDDFGFDDALSRFREGQTNRQALEDQAQTAKYKRMAEEQAAARRVQEEELGIAGLSDAEKAAYFRNMAQQQQSGIAGAGIEQPKAGPNLRLVKKAAGGPVDLRSGIGNVFKLYS